MKEGGAEIQTPEWRDSIEGVKSMLYHYCGQFLIDSRLGNEYSQDLARKSIETANSLKEKATNEKLLFETDRLLEKLGKVENQPFSTDLLDEIDEILTGINEIK